MKKIQIVDDEYVSTYGPNGIHLGFISDGFNVTNYDVNHISHDEIYKQAEEIFRRDKKYPSTSYFRLVIDTMPPEIENQIDKIGVNLEAQQHKVSDNQLIIDWLTETYEEEDFFADQNFDYYLVLPKEIIEDGLNDESLAEKYDFELENDTIIPDHQKAAYTREIIENSFTENVDPLAIHSILFKTKNTSLVMGFSVYMIFPQVDPEITWIDFFLNDASFQNYLEERTDWIMDTDNLSDTEILKLWS